LITDLLDISRIEAGAVDLELSDVSLAALLAEVRDTTAPLAAANYDQVVLDVEGALPDIRTDRHRLRQVLLNLTSNACKFTERGRVVLSAETAPDDPVAVLLRVRDTGVGMTAEQLARIFEPFVQVHASIARRRQGSGLGLTISRRLVEALGGAITVESQPGLGTTCTVRLPRYHPAVSVSTISNVSRVSRP
jgi:adenylate cyclase